MRTTFLITVNMFCCLPVCSYSYTLHWILETQQQTLDSKWIDTCFFIWRV